ncbi:SRPBCC family protein [Pedosphaera parvula]|uniref:Activator of Hsp90 ATPase 1 family protein n=1 Tax=Pedosphaera parvula (strain Ellin514) TaxID=320771 RepID=B9XQC5_PEDPL|nr:SRPBCC domain-containing protein [Pedosphaera parvula]EEF57949.1 Activator of Hsp90 ATPase 1 family protein [Pedosphaera parvula Ellin514]
MNPGKNNPTEKTTEKPFVLSRTFNAPRELMWKAWTERERLMQWFGPKGFTMLTAKLDFRPGGTFHYCLQGPDGNKLWGKFVYREIVALEKIVWVNSFSDEAGGTTRHPMAATWPLEMLSTCTLTEKDGKTTLTIEWQPLNATEAEQKTFDSALEAGGMNQGWSGTFEQLAAYVEKH